MRDHRIAEAQGDDMSEETDIPNPETPVLDASPDGREAWFRAMDERCADEGYFEPVGKRHWAWLHDDGPNLLVSFESIDSILARPGKLSFGHSVAAPRGWSHLCVISDGETWFRDERLYRYFDRLVDEGFFEDFDRVVFHGSGPSSHAACAYAVCAPGASVLALRPRATLDPAVTGWDDRFTAHRRLDFSSRYGFAPDMIEGAGAVWLVFDPTDRADLGHAALFRGSHVRHLRARHAGERIEEVLETTGIVTALLSKLCDGTLSAADFPRLWRARRQNAGYLRELLLRVEATQGPRRLWIAAREINARAALPRARRLLGRLNPIYAPQAAAASTAPAADEVAED